MRGPPPGMPRAAPAGMDEARPRLRPRTLTEHGPHRATRALSISRAELVRYFAWGYLSRRELNERLKVLAPSPREVHTAA